MQILSLKNTKKY